MTMYKIIGGDQREYGPASAEEISRWISEGRLSSQSLLQLEGSGEWKALAQYPEFAEALAAQVGHAPETETAVTPANFQAWIASILGRAPQLRIGSCLARGWKLTQANFLLFSAAAFAVWFLSLLAFIPVLGLPFGVLSWVLDGVLYGGMFVLILKRVRGQPASLADVFCGFKLSFLQLVLAGIVSSFLSSLGICACFIGWLYLVVAWILCVPLVADKGIEFWTAMEVSRRVVTRVWFEMLVLLVLAFLPFLLAHVVVQVKLYTLCYPLMREMMSASQPDIARAMELMSKNAAFALPHVLASRFVLLLNLPFALSVLMYAYEDLFGARPSPKS